MDLILKTSTHSDSFTMGRKEVIMSISLEKQLLMLVESKKRVYLERLLHGGIDHLENVDHLPLKNHLMKLHYLE